MGSDFVNHELLTVCFYLNPVTFFFLSLDPVGKWVVCVCVWKQHTHRFIYKSLTQQTENNDVVQLQHGISRKDDGADSFMNPIFFLTTTVFSV